MVHETNHVSTNAMTVQPAGYFSLSMAEMFASCNCPDFQDATSVIKARQQLFLYLEVGYAGRVNKCITYAYQN